MIVRIPCPHCRQNYQVPTSKLGQKATCKVCGQPFDLLAQQEDEQEYELMEPEKGPPPPLPASRPRAPQATPSQRENPSQPRFCTGCGSPVAWNVAFCGNCGQPTRTAAAPTFNAAAGPSRFAAVGSGAGAVDMPWYAWWPWVWANKYWCFEGRARRKEFWFFGLGNLIATVVALFTLGFFEGAVTAGEGFGGTGEPVLANLVELVYSLVSIPLGLGLATRRLHDVGRSGWWQLIVLTVVGAVILLVFFVQDSEPGANQYGPNPKG